MNWEYNSKCRVIIPVANNQCSISNNPPQVCFTESIKYNYTLNTNMPDFPQNLEIFQRFPKYYFYIFLIFLPLIKSYKLFFILNLKFFFKFNLYLLKKILDVGHKLAH